MHAHKNMYVIIYTCTYKYACNHMISTKVLVIFPLKVPTSEYDNHLFSNQIRYVCSAIRYDTSVQQSDMIRLFSNQIRYVCSVIRYDTSVQSSDTIRLFSHQIRYACSVIRYDTSVQPSDTKPVHMKRRTHTQTSRIHAAQRFTQTWCS